METADKKVTIGKLLQLRRKARKIPQEQLADIAGVSTRTIRDIEKGIANPELDTLLKMCRVLGMDLNIEVIK